MSVTPVTPVSLCFYLYIRASLPLCLSLCLSVASHRVSIQIYNFIYPFPLFSSSFLPFHSSPSNPKSSRILGSSYTRMSRSAKSGFSHSRLCSGATANGPTCWPGHDQAAWSGGMVRRHDPTRDHVLWRSTTGSKGCKGCKGHRGHRGHRDGHTPGSEVVSTRA